MVSSEEGWRGGYYSVDSKGVVTSEHFAANAADSKDDVRTARSVCCRQFAIKLGIAAIVGALVSAAYLHPS